MAVKTRNKTSRNLSAKVKAVDKNGGKKKVLNDSSQRKAACPWMELEPPPFRTLKVYALDPSAGNYVGNVMSVKIKWEDDLKPGPIGAKIAVVDYDGANKCYYPPVDLDDPKILARGGLDPSESDPRFHQQMVYAVATETIERFETALGRNIRWRRADRPRGFDQENKGDSDEGGSWRKTKDIWTLNLFPHAMVQANAFYSPEAKGILFGYFTAEETDQGNNLPGQRVFTCLSHDIIAHEVTHAIIDGIRTYFTEPTNPDVLAFHEAFSDLAALFTHFSHKEALLDTIQKTGGRLYQFELKPDAAPPEQATSANDKDKSKPTLHTEFARRNPLIELAQQFGEASGMGRGLRGALDRRPHANDINTRISDVHFRGSILVAAVFDAYFSIYLKRTADLFRVYRAGGTQPQPDDLPGPLARLLAEQASATAAEFFQLCARALDYCPPVDITFGDFLRALITANIDLKDEDGYDVRDALMQAFRVRGIYPESAAFFSQDSLCWPRVPKWTDPPAEGALPPVEVMLEDPITKQKKLTSLVFGDPNGLTTEEKDINGAVLRQYAEENAVRLGFNADPSLPLEFKPYAPSFHPVFRVGKDGSLRTDMVVELVQTQRVPFDKEMPGAGSFPFRAGVTLIISAPKVYRFSGRGKAYVRFAIGKTMVGPEAEIRMQTQRAHVLGMGLAEGNTEDPNHFQVNFGLLHEGL
ncbi:MAG TPA: hypothetical protein VJU84_05465 [Pyrinomonadaceae bacterium]|nr:hypothetical protein [Pyrinomonadaceae bacterium]